MSEPNPNITNTPAAPAAVAVAPSPGVAAPAAPKPAPKPPAKPGSGDDRRFFLSWLINWWVIGWATFTATMTVFTLGSLRFMMPNVLNEPPSKFKAGFPDTYEDNKVTDRYKDQNAWVVKHLGKIYALSTTCTHLGCTPNWLEREQKFKCPCHGSGFYITGINFEGPAPRPLERWAVSIGDDGQIVIDKSKKFQEERGEWSNPESFIKV
jgi:cytochrome b6-f complex iron-sulfur subunit